MKVYKTIFMLSIAMLVMISFSLTAFSFTRDELAKYKEKTLMAPDFTLKDLNGKTYKLSDFRGKRIIVLETGSST